MGSFYIRVGGSRGSGASFTDPTIANDSAVRASVERGPVTNNITLTNTTVDEILAQYPDDPAAGW